MTVDGIDVETTIKKVQELLAKEQNLSPALSTTLEALLVVVQALVNRLGLNSHKPPSSDKNRPREKRIGEGGRKAGGQTGSAGATLRQTDDPDEIKVLAVDRSILPPGQYRKVGFERRQVFDIDISRLVTEYRSEVLEDEDGRRFVVPFPDHVTKAVQYGNNVKAHAVYLSQYQLIPYHRMREYFQDQTGLPISVQARSTTSISSYTLPEPFEQKLIEKLKARLCCIPMKRASISMARHIGCIVAQMKTGHCFMHILTAAPMP